MSEIARFATRLRPQQRRELGLPRKKGTRAFYEVPSYSVFYQLLTRMDPAGFADILTGWLSEQQGSLPVGQVKSVSDLVAAINGDGAGPVEYNSVSKACKDLIKPGTRPDGSKKEPLLLEVVANRAGGGGKGNTGAKAYTRLATPKSSIE